MNVENNSVTHGNKQIIEKYPRRAISKHYWQFENANIKRIFDNRLSLSKNISLAEQGLDFVDVKTKISIYEDRVFEWFLNIALKLKNDNEGGFVILQIALSQIEGIQQYYQGISSKKKSQKFFAKAMKRVFPELLSESNIDKLLEEFYKETRCGLFHDGMTKPKVVINAKFEHSIRINNSFIEINPHKFLDRVISDFRDYMYKLKDENEIELRKLFLERFTETG